MEERYPHVKYSLRVFIRNPDEIPAQRIIDAIFLRRAVFRVSAGKAFVLRDSSGTPGELISRLPFRSPNLGISVTILSLEIHAFLIRA